MRIALVQQNVVVGDFDGNVARLAAAVDRAATDGADLAICSELAVCGYPPLDLLDQPAFVDVNLRAVDALAARVPIPTVVGFVDRVGRPAGRKLHNAAAVVDRGRIASVHHKSLLPTYDVFDEQRYFEPARSLALADVGGVKLAITICEDMWNDADFWPERYYDRDPVAELVALGPDILVNIGASPFTVAKRSLRPRMFAALARKYRLPLIAVNQVGGNDELLFDGASHAFSPDGETAARAAEFDEDVIVCDVEPRGAVSGPMRAPLPSDEAAALAALAMGVRDYAARCGFRSAVLGLSGGIDSALTACIAARALGSDRVVGVAMPSRFSSEHSVADARALAGALGIAFQVIPIEQPFASMLALLEPAFDGRPPDVTEENLQARLRGVILMALSNKFGHLLLSTGNKSELAVGYCTLYGDMSGGLAVISDVPKTLVYALAREVNRQAGRPIIPESTLTKPPSAELRPGQTDQDSLPPYDVLDHIVELYVERNMSRDEIAATGAVDRATVDRVVDLVQRSEYKRRQAAPGLKITTKAFGFGRRVPIAQRWRG
ncbi:MAG: NAD+ synthase [Deltaproteobacteria bacterium]|nr:MAG: NAD+ synthase [Deltaproteobacteria bacterium]